MASLEEVAHDHAISELPGKAGEDHIRRGTHELSRLVASALVFATNPALVDADVGAVAALGPSAAEF